MVVEGMKGMISLFNRNGCCEEEKKMGHEVEPRAMGDEQEKVCRGRDEGYGKFVL